MNLSEQVWGVYYLLGSFETSHSSMIVSTVSTSLHYISKQTDNLLVLNNEAVKTFKLHCWLSSGRANSMAVSQITYFHKYTYMKCTAHILHLLKQSTKPYREVFSQIEHCSFALTRKYYHITTGEHNRCCTVIHILQPS